MFTGNTVRSPLPAEHRFRRRLPRRPPAKSAARAPQWRTSIVTQTSVICDSSDRLEQVRERRELCAQALAGLRQVASEHGHEPRIEQADPDIGCAAQDLATISRVCRRQLR